MSSGERPRRKTWHDLKRAKPRDRTAIPDFLVIVRRAVQRRSSERVARVSVARCSVGADLGSSSSNPGRGGMPRACVAAREGCSITA